MFPLLLLLGGLYFLYRSSSTSSTATPVSGGAKLVPDPSSNPPDIKGSITKDALFGDAPLPTLSGFDGSAFDLGALGIPSLTPGMPGFGYGAPSPFPTWTGWPSSMVAEPAVFASLAETQAPREVPSGAHVATTSAGTEAPLDAGQRVSFTVDSADGSYGRLEGAYGGPSNPATGTSYVYVDRIAVRPSDDAMRLPFGRYTIEASDSALYHTKLDPVVWFAVDPATVGLYGFASAPAVSVGDKVTIAVRDLSGTVVVAIAKVISADTYGLKLLLSAVYRVLQDAGYGAIVLPATESGRTVAATASQLVDPASLPPPPSV